MGGSAMSMSSEGVDSPFDHILIKEEPDDEFIPEDLQIDTQSVYEDSIDIKEEEIGYGLSNSISDTDNPIQDSSIIDSLSVDQSSQIPIKFERYLNHSSKKNKKCHPPMLKAPQICSICNMICATERVLTNHKKTHNGEKSAMMELPAKRSLPLENEKVNSSGPPEKKRKIVCETGVRNDEEMQRIWDEIVAPSVDERNPLTHKDNKEILERILSNLGKMDLLNARLVSRAWNDESLKVLQKSKFTQMLRDWEMERYILFAKSNKPHQLILPFHLDFSICSSSLYLAQYKKILTEYVGSLCQMFGQSCVSTLTLTADDTDWTDENIKETGLVKFLRLIAPGLKTLDLKKFCPGIDFLKNQMIYFPNLKKLICNTSNCLSGGSGPGRAYISLIVNSPNLEDLTLTDPCDLEWWPLKFNQLKSLSLGQLIKPQNILDKIRSSSGPPVLRELSIALFSGELWSAQDKIVVYKILKSVSTTLKSLTFRGHTLARNAGNLRFPKLHQLEHFRLEYDIANTSRLQTETIDISPENFPSLKSIELPIGYIFKSSPVQPEDDGDVRIDFPNIIKLTLRVNTTVGPQNVNGPLEDLQQLFPTPSKLSLVNTGGDDFVNYVLYRIVKSNWSKSIQQIEMIGFSEYYLGPILNRLEFIQRVDLDLAKWYWMLDESLQTEFQDTMNRIRMEFKETVGDDPNSIILRREIQWNCQNEKQK